MNRPFFEKITIQLDDPNHHTHIIFLWAAITAGLLLRITSATLGQGYHHYAVNDEISAYHFLLRFLSGDPSAIYLSQAVLSQGQLPGPLWTLFCTALYKLGGNTLTGAVIWMAVFNSFSIYLVYRLAMQLVTARMAILSTVLFSIGAWPVYYSAGLWNPMPLIVLGTLMLLLLWHVSTNNRSWLIAILAIVVAIMPQFHMIGIFYFPVVLVILYLGKAKLHKAWLATGIICSILIYLPYLVYDAQNGWKNSHGMITSTQQGAKPGVLKIISAPVTVLSNSPGRWPGEDVAEMKHFGDSMFGSYFVLFGIAILSLFNGLVFFSSFIVICYRQYHAHWRNPVSAYADSPQIMFAGLLLVLPLLLFLLTGKNYSTRYAIPVFSLLFLLPMIFYQNLVSSKWKQFWKINISFQAIFGIYLLLAFFVYQHSAMNDSSRFIASFSKLESIANIIRKDAGQGQRVAVRLASNIEQLDETHRKVYRAIIEYTEIQQAMVDNLPENLPVTRYIVTLAGETSLTGSGKPVFADNGIFILRENY